VALVAVLLYMAFGSLIDVLIVLSNVVALASAACGAAVDADEFQHLRRGRVHLHLWRGGDGCHLAGLVIPPRALGWQASGGGGYLRLPSPLAAIMMTALTAIFGLMPAALSTRIGAQSQRPLAIVVIGGMIAALVLNRYLTPVLYSVVRRQPPRKEGAVWGGVD